MLYAIGLYSHQVLYSLAHNQSTPPPSPLPEASGRGKKVPLQCVGEGFREGLDSE